MTLDRRNFIKLMGSASGLALAGCATEGGAPGVATTGEIMAKSGGRRVVVIGGGYGGAIAAKYVRMMDASIEVVLIERNRQFVSCPFSNFYITGLAPDMGALTIGYDKLAANHGVKMVYDEVTAIDPAAKKVVTKGGTLAYDRLIVSPGVDFRTEEIEGYDEHTPHMMPHAWKAGEQSTILRNQLMAMPNGGKVIISMPLTPYRCPPGPYERASLVAQYLKKHKPKSKVILLDANPDIVSKKPLFAKAWKEFYPGILEYVPGKKITKVDAKNKTVFVEGIEDIKGDVVNLIPAQRAGHIAVAAGLVGDDKKWCPITPVSFESTKHPGIHVIGDACAIPSDGPPMPKSGYAANSQAKVCATNVVNLMNGKEMVDFSGINVCYSAISDHQSVTIAQVFKLVNGKVKSAATAISPADFSLGVAEHTFGESWLKNILTEMST